MSKKTATAVPAYETPKAKARADIHVPKECKCDIAGFGDVSVDEVATIIITGRVSELRDRADDWDSGKHVCMEPSSVKIYGPDEPVSMDEAIAKTRKKV